MLSQTFEQFPAQTASLPSTALLEPCYATLTSQQHSLEPLSIDHVASFHLKEKKKLDFVITIVKVTDKTFAWHVSKIALKANLPDVYWCIMYLVDNFGIT
jgi:hypothetical protein